MNKPLTMIINETQTKLVDVCNESGLSPAILDLVMKPIYFDIHSLAIKQAKEDEINYMKSIEKKSETPKIETT